MAHAQQPAQGTTPGTVRGTVIDSGGALIPAAHVELSGATVATARETVSDTSGDFIFSSVPPGPFTLKITAKGFEPEKAAATLHPGEVLDLPPVALPIATATTDIDVQYTHEELAQQEVKAAESQRVFGIIPNFFVVYKTNPVSLSAKQKYHIAFRGIIDPFTFVATGIVAGVEQADNTLPGYGNGDFPSYAKRYGAAYANSASATMLRGAVFPALLHQDPRYFYKGTGSKWSRVGYALSTAVRCKGDNGKWQPNYSSLLGNMSAGALTNLYFPEGSRNGASTTIENGLLNTVGVGVGHVLQEFVFGHITTHRHALDANP